MGWSILDRLKLIIFRPALVIKFHPALTAIIFNEKFSEKDVLESGKKDLENIFDKSTEVYNYFIKMIELIESENKK